LADNSTPPKPSFGQQIAAAINADAARGDAVAQQRQVDTQGNPAMRHRLANTPKVQPQPAATGPRPSMDDWIRSPEFQRSLGGPQPAAAEIAPASPPGVGDVGAPSSDTAAEAAPIDPSTVPETADGYVISLPPDLPADLVVNESYSAQIKQFAFENKLPQGFMNKMAAAVVKNDLAKIAADKVTFTNQANAVIAQVGKDRVLALGAHLDRTASTPAAAAAIKQAMLVPGVVELLEKSMRSGQTQTRNGPIEMVRGIFFP
jgi:hypothetical protein